MTKTTAMVAVWIGFFLLLIPMLIVDILVSPLSTYRRVRQQIMLPFILAETRQMLYGIERDVMARRASKDTSLN